MKEEQAHTEQGGAAEEDEEEEERGWTRSQWLATTSSPPPAPLPRSRSQPGGIGRGHRRQPFGGRGGWGWIEEQRLAPAQGEHTAKTPEARRTPETLRRKRGAANGNANASVNGHKTKAKASPMHPVRQPSPRPLSPVSTVSPMRTIAPLDLGRFADDDNDDDDDDFDYDAFDSARSDMSNISITLPPLYGVVGCVVVCCCVVVLLVS